MQETGLREPKVARVTDDKLALNEHERITQIYTQRNLHTTGEKKHAECEKYINIRNKKGHKENTK